MFYIVETSYEGPNKEQNIDADKIEISTLPATTNMSHEVKTSGWCGTTNGWAVYAHGEYETIEEARNAIKSHFGPIRDYDGDKCCLDDSVIEAYMIGEYIPMNEEDTRIWVSAGLHEDISAETTDDRIDELAIEYENLANDEGYTLSPSLEDIIVEIRQELRDEENEYNL